MHVRLPGDEGDVEDGVIGGTAPRHGKSETVRQGKHGSFDAIPDRPAGRRRGSSLPLPAVFKRRWVMLALFSIVTMSNAICWITFAPISDLVEAWYDVSPFMVNSLSIVFMATYIPFVFFSSWVLDRFGLRTCVSIGAVLTSAGQWIRFAGAPADGFAVLWLGQFVTSVGQAFLLGIPARLSAVWFGADERNTATALGVVANQFGVAIGFVVPPQIVEQGSDLELLLLVEAIFSAVGALGILVAFRNEPPMAPSFAAISTATPGTQRSYRGQLVVLLKDRNFLLLMSAYGANVGMYYALSTFINQFLSPHFPGADIVFGWVGSVLVVAGIIGDVVVGYVLDKTHAYRKGFLALNGLCCVSYVAFLVGAMYESWLIVFGASALVGAFGTSVLVLGLEFAAQITFPVPEATSSGLLNLSAQLWGTVLWTLVGVLVAAEMLLLPVKPDLKRKQTEHIMRTESMRKRGVTPASRTTSTGSRNSSLLATSSVAHAVLDDGLLDSPTPGADRRLNPPAPRRRSYTED